MVAVLGVSALYHDAAAALVIDGEVVAAIQEERLSRIKYDACLPWRAMRACLAQAQLPAQELSSVVFYEQPFVKLERLLLTVLHRFPRSFGSFVRGLRAQLGDKLWVLDTLADGLGVDRKRVRCVPHHRSHAASAFFMSGAERAAVLTLDGVGEWDTTAIWLGEGRTLRKLEAIPYPHSLGLFYAGLTAYLGFEVLDGEYKVMGLAAHGRADHVDLLEKTLRLYDDGTFEIDTRFFDLSGETELGYRPALEKLLGPARPPGKPWDLKSPEDQRYADIAASTQRLLEDAVLGLAQRARELTGCDQICLAGGVALNARANRRVLREAGFRHVFVQPAAGDAGGALGAAILGALEDGDPSPAAMTHAALGVAVDPGQACELAHALGLSAQRVDDPVARAAELLDRNRLLGFVTGRFEWGPRALGQRSLLASPHSRQTRERLNRVVKMREPFRPFAPAVLADEAAQWFDDAPNELTPFMTTLCQATTRGQEQLQAVMHQDGTSRVQSVRPESAPGLHDLLQAYGSRSGAGVLLNTSLNGAGEPIVASAADAISFFASHALDALLIEDVLISR